MMTKKLERELRKMAHDFEDERLLDGICYSLHINGEITDSEYQRIVDVINGEFELNASHYREGFLPKGRLFYKPENSHIRAIIIYLIIEILKDENDTTLH